MVAIPPEYVINSTLVIGRIYRFNAPELIGTTIPHYFIVVAIDCDDNYLVICTTQGSKKEQYFDKAGLDYTGLVCIKPDGNNQLTDVSWVNCNDSYLVTKTQLITKVRDGILSVKGEISLDHYFQIREGIKQSHTSDIPISLVVHPNE